MSSSGRSDYIARIRYLNKLPQPPNPPKLLHIPGEGLDGNHYTEGSYASRLVREQPLNIEADSELGMPIDLVGLPGVFDGDESCIQGLDEPPLPHPHDKPLLKPLSALGKAAASASGVSFLRRTEYMSSNQSAQNRVEPAVARDTLRQKTDAARKRKHADASADEPSRIIRDIENSFLLANDQSTLGGGEATSAMKSLWNNPRHPSKPQLKLLDSYPLLPDPEATPDTGSYSMIKFNTNPVASTKRYDQRLDVAVLRPRDPRPEVMEMHRAKLAEKGEGEQIPYDYDLFLAKDEDMVEDIKRNVDGVEDEAQSFEFPRIRTYETGMTAGSVDEPYNDTLALALYDDDEHEGVNGDSEGTDNKRRKLAKGAYFYPVGSRVVIRPARGGWGHATSDNVVVDLLDVSYRPPDENEIEQRKELSSRYEAPTVDAAA